MLHTRDPPHKNFTVTESKGLEKIFQANAQEKNAVIAIHISDKLDFRTKALKGDTE